MGDHATRAIARSSFRAVLDGDLYPSDIAPGQPLTGSLAAVALTEGWAVAPETDAEFEAAVMAFAPAPPAVAAEPADMAAALATILDLRRAVDDRDARIAVLEAELAAARAAAKKPGRE